MTTEVPRETFDLEGAPEEHYFDDLAHGLASGMLSRRRALKLMGTAVLGGALGLLSLPKEAEAGARRILYHNGPLMTGGANVYFIWYGSWTGSTAPDIVTDLVTSIGGSAYFNINTTYYDATGARPVNSVIFGGSINDDYSRGTALADADVAAVVSNAITSAQLPLDPNGIYFVFGASDVTVTQGNTASCTTYCGMHNVTTVNAIPVKYAFVPNPERCPALCAFQIVGPNGSLAGDAMASHVAALLSSTVTNPHGDGWYDKRGRENADKCTGRFGTTYTVANGAKANMRLGQRDYLIQKNWVNKGRGYCALSYP